MIYAYLRQYAKAATMARLTIVLPDDLTRDLRIRAVEVYNGEKGALGKAVADAVRVWLKQPSPRKK
jgi:hypothetical protein